MERKPLPDVLKGIAVILMIQVHIMELLMLPVVYNSSFGYISLFLGGVPAAPVFMAIMGYFAALSKKSSGQQAVRGIKLIILGFFLNIGLNAHLLIRIFRGELEFNPLHYIFGVDILFLAGLSLIFIALVKMVAGKNVWVFLLLTFSIPALAEYTPFLYQGEGIWKYFMAFIISNAEWSYFPFFPWAGWVLAGFTFALFEKKLTNDPVYMKFGTYLVFLSGIPVIFFLPWASRISTILPYYYHHGILFFIWGLFFLLLWVLAFQFLISRLGKNPVMSYLQWFGKNVTLAYVVQWLIIGNLATAIFRSQPAYMFWVFLFLVLPTTTAIVFIAGKRKRT
ncbi:MAG: DUF1624 domain-containing protein [Bacteroidetes bacterium]|nr:DUF1624 domain-containing protein [Bacteroidota bacterium]MCK5764683.1 DUF1624 domain-containing protein [Bacteroidales bacterium]